MSDADSVIEVRGFSAWYGTHAALEDVSLDVLAGEILGIIGPAGGGKSTFLRSLNRLNDLQANFRSSGTIRYLGLDLADPRVDVARLRRRIGMVFAVPVPLPGTIRDNLALGPSFNGTRADLPALMEKTLRAAYLWDEVKDRLGMSAFSLSGGQQQRLCLARTLMMEPDVLLLDEPCSGLDPISTAKIEDALEELKKEVTVVLVTNNVMQASRVADRTAFFLQGRLVECGPTAQLFLTPKETVTNEYVSGRFG
ncbi:MAG: phosphate ABC transporter ATP-binding protein [Planctomycetales bacterium]|nr:phosphate ABC transporter ATP-binding protein [Planctomycetales bacterium]